MKIAKTRLVYTDKDEMRQEVDAGTEIKGDLKIPDNVMKRFEDSKAVAEETAEEKAIREKKAAEGKAAAEPKDDKSKGSKKSK